jgi:hypothetical protein
VPFAAVAVVSGSASVGTMNLSSSACKNETTAYTDGLSCEHWEMLSWATAVLMFWFSPYIYRYERKKDRYRYERKKDIYIYRYERKKYIYTYLYEK